VYYRGLKDNVKDELMRYGGDQSTTETLQKAAIKVGDMLYERYIEKRHTNTFRGRSSYVPYSGSGGQQRRDPDAMEIDNIQKRPREQGRKDGVKGKQHAQGQKRKGPECYNCHKIGHYARDCRGKKMQPQQEVNMMTRKDDDYPTDKSRGASDTTGKATNPEHDTLHWKFCYEDSCTTHYSSKMDAGWFPYELRKEVNVIEQSGEEFNEVEKEERTDPSTPQARLQQAMEKYEDLSRRAESIVERWRTLRNERNNTPLQNVRESALADQALCIRIQQDAIEEQIQLLRAQGARERREFNMISIRDPQQQARDDGNRARGRSPPPFRWEDAILQENRSPTLEEEYVS